MKDENIKNYMDRRVGTCIITMDTPVSKWQRDPPASNGLQQVLNPASKHSRQISINRIFTIYQNLHKWV